MTQKTERRVIAGDWKRVYLDLPNWELLAPPEGIYDEPTVYYKANIRWAKLIEGFLAHLTEITAWKDAEDENFWGTQQIITFLERVEVPFVFPEESGCNNFLPSAAFVSYYPQNPYNQPDYIPDDYLVPPFFVNDELEYPEALGYKATDVFIAPASINIDPIDLITLNLPRIEITVRGSGQLEIDFLAVQAGSSAILKIGSMPNIIDIITGGIIEEGVTIIDLNNDSISIPPEKDIVQSEEVNIIAEPDELTTVYIVFVPIIDDALIPLALGGGIRQIGLCAFEDMEEGGQVEAVRFNEENCSFEQRVNGEWAVIEGNEFIATCLGGGMSVEEICEGVICAMEQAASRFLSGVAGNTEGGVTIGTDGSITIVAGGIPIDDPTTAVNESLAASMGGAIAVARGLELLFDKLDAYYGAVNGTPAFSEFTAQTGIKMYFPCDGAIMDGAITNYYSYRGTNGQLAFNTSAAFEQYLFCNGANEQGFNRWLVDLSGYAEQKRVIMAGLVTGLAEEFFSQYFAKGVGVPSMTYLDADCTPSPTETLLMPVLGTAYTTATVWKKNHRLQLTITGWFVDTADTPVNDIRDFWWYRQGSTSQLFYQAANNNMQLGTGITKPSSNQVPYNTGHSYVCTIDTPIGGGGVLQITIPVTSMTTPVTTTNGFTVVIKDLGQIS